MMAARPLGGEFSVVAGPAGDGATGGAKTAAGVEMMPLLPCVSGPLSPAVAGATHAIQAA